jgi:hypothetical protein
MSLGGNLRTMSLPDILQWAAVGRKTGTLHLERGSTQKGILFRDGEIYSSWSTDPRESLGQFLIRERCITEEQLFNCLLRQEEQGRLMGAILVSEGLLDEEALRRVLKTKVEETIYDLFLWPEGRFEFREGQPPSNIQIHVAMMVTAVILEGIRRVDEWARIRKVFPSGRVTFRLQGAPLDVDDPLERHALGLAAAGKTLAEISLELRRSEFETAALLFQLLARDLLVVDRVETDDRVVDPVAAIKDLLAEAYQHLQARRHTEAVQAYEAVLALDRLNQNAKKGLIAAVEARDRDRLLRSMPLDKIPVLAVDLATLTRERFDPQEGFVLSRVNGQWDVRSILKLCPMSEQEALLIFARLLERKVIELR